MNRTLLLLVAVSLFSTTQFAQNRTTRRANPTQLTIANAPSQTLPIRRVILYSNGVAYIERRGTVTGHAEISLSFKQSQVDDVLKSMVVLDLGQGRIGAVSYNSSAPPAARLSDIPFSIDAGSEGENGGGLAGVLSQLQGAHVAITTANRTAIGSILTVEERKPEKEGLKASHCLVITSETGELMSFDLDEVRSIKLIDEGARRDLNEFASASASARRRDAKTIVVTSDGTGAREMLVSYTIAAPIWKTTYRVVLDSSEKPFFQGWAIVDNVSEEDWKNISLSLVSGSPVSFIQQIQRPFYRYRPIVPMPEDLNLDPQLYEPAEGGGGPGGGGGGVAGTVSGVVTDPNGAVVPGATVTITNSETQQSVVTTTSSEGRYTSPVLTPGTYTVKVDSSGFKSAVLTNLPVRSNSASRGNIRLEVGSVQEVVTITASQQADISSNTTTVRGMYSLNGRVSNTSSLDGVSISDAITQPESGVETAATGSEVGDLFEYRIDQPVTVPRDRSALIPILQTRMEGERVSIYNESARQDRPMGGILLKNTSPLTLEGGALTVIEGDAYAGEALMERLKPGEQRLISFELDLGTLVTARAKEKRAPTFLVRAVNGVFQAHYHQTNQKIYVVTNQTDKPRVVMIEHPVRQDWTLSGDTQKPEEKTANYYRFRMKVGPHEKLELPVTEQRVLMETYTLTNFTRQDLELFIAKNYIDANTRTTLERIIDLRSRLAAKEARVESIDSEVEEIAKDQERLRDNIKALTATAEAKQLITRYVAKADNQETRLEQLNKEKQALGQEITGLEGELETVVRGLSIDRKLTD
jgi:carboxypeptidase family protein